jgi:hypothetical protein
MLVGSHLRLAAGVCVLAAGLLMGGAGGTVAVADPGSRDPVAQADDGTTASGQQPSAGAKKPKKAPGGTGSDESTVGSGRQPGQHPPAPAKGPKKEPDGPGSTLSSGPAVPHPVAAVPTVAAPAPVPTVVAPAPVPTVAAPAPDALAALPDVAPVPEVVALDAAVRSLMASVPTLFAPGSDVIASIQDMLTSVAGGVVPLTQLQSDLYSFLLSMPGLTPVVAALGGIHRAGLSAAAHAWVTWRLELSLAGIAGGPMAGNVTGVVTPVQIAASIFAALTQVGRASSLPGMAPLAPNGAIPMGKQAFFHAADSQLLLPGSLAAVQALAMSGTAGLAILSAAGVLPVSLAALAAVALPGVGGLVILTAAGVRVGHRQAKAGFAVRMAGIARFARPGTVPLGVINSGSLVVVRPRALRVFRPGGSNAGCLLDKVA